MQPSNQQLSSNLELELTTCNSGNYTNRIMMKLLPWCKLKKSKNVFRDSLSCDDISSMVTIKKDHDKKCLSSKLFSSKKVKSKNCINYLASPCPVVSFVNKGDGLVSVDLMNRVMVNENELYSLNVAGLSNFSSVNSLSNISSSLSSKSTPTLQLQSSDESECDILPEWFVGSICRDAAISILSKQPIGAFIVRESITKPGCYALSVRVPKRYHVTGVAHYLIIRNSSGIFKIKVHNTGFAKEFTSLHSLIIHHSIMQELLPCPLNLAVVKGKREDCYSKNEERVEVNKFTNYDINNELLVDIDSDPDYQRILTQFRKSMANCI